MKKNIGKPSLILIISNIVLCLILAAILIAFAIYKNSTMEAMATKDSQNDKIVENYVSQISSQQQEIDDYIKANQENLEKGYISRDFLKERATDFNVGTEFLQGFFDDAIIYKDKDGIVFAPIDENLPKHNYNYDNLEKVDGIYQYIVDGEKSAQVGIDVSKYQGDINWQQVKQSGIDYAILRLGYRGYQTGKIMLDECFENNIKGATAAGINIGVYFYSTAITKEEAIEEAEFVFENIKGYTLKYPVVFDTEDPADETARVNDLTVDELTDITITFCEAVKEKGYTPMVYANAKWFLTRLDMSRLLEYDKWIAQYYKIPFFPYQHEMWQYTGKGKVNGINGDVDLNVSFKDYSK